MPAYFSPRVFTFLKQLKRNNNREWFLENKERYISEVRDPMLAFIEAFGRPLDSISSFYLADPRSNGGSMFRIYRDTRFSKDKDPYKTHAAAQFRHVKGRDVHAPGFYLHLEPGMVFAGAGLWHPDAKTANAIREAIAADPKEWKRAIGGTTFKRKCTLEGESLKRPPRGFDADHPLIEDLKRKDFIAATYYTEAQACSGDFLTQFSRTCRTMAPLMRFLTGALGLKW